MDQEIAYHFSTRRRPVILLVESDADMATMVSNTLEEAGYSCHTIYETHDIISLVELHQPQLIIIDYLLPKVNGGELCSNVKNHYLYHSIPVIIYSAYAKVFHSLGHYRSDAFIAKPFLVSELICCISKLLAQQVLIKQ